MKRLWAAFTVQARSRSRPYAPGNADTFWTKAFWCLLADGRTARIDPRGDGDVEHVGA